MSTPESAVHRCVKAYYDACDIEDPHDTGLDPAARYRVHLAYRHAMPYLLPDPDSIDAFLACVTHGLVIQVFQPAEASKLLYAAQVAIGSRRARTKPPAKTPNPTPSRHPPPPPQPEAMHPCHNPPVPHLWRQLHRHHGWRPQTPTNRTDKTHHPHPPPPRQESHRTAGAARAGIYQKGNPSRKKSGR